VADAGQKQGFAAWAWALVACVALLEVGAQPLIRAAVPDDDAWKSAADFVRARYRPTDRIVAAPLWVDPIVRHHLGDLLSFSMAAPSDSAGIDRVWELSVRGAVSRSDPPDIEEDFGGVWVRMWRLSPENIEYDFVDHVTQAEVELVGPEGPGRCPYRKVRPDRGGLGRGPMPPDSRFVCDGRRPWLWVGQTVLADLELRPRQCISQHPAGLEPFRVTFFDVPLGDRLVVHAGIDYTAERQQIYSPVTLRVFIDDQLAGELVHHDGDGWSRTEVDTSELGPGPSTVRFETTTTDPKARLFCWAASSRSRSRDD